MRSLCCFGVFMFAGVSLTAGGALDPIKTVTIGENRALCVNGKPFFPIMSWAQATHRFQKLRSLNFNTFCGSGKTAQEALEKAEAAGGYAIVHWNRLAPEIKGHPSLLAYALRDEPDLDIHKGKARVAAREVLGWYRDTKAEDPSLPVFLNYTAAFMKHSAGERPQVKAYYEATAKAADILCFDIYPIYQKNRDDKLTWVAEGVTQLRGIAGPRKPVWAWIETSKGSKWITYGQQKDVTPAITRSEVWMALIRGATGIGYFTHAWRPRFTEFAPTPAMQEELKRTNGQITRLAPVLLSGPSRLKAEIEMTRDGDRLHAEIMVKEHEGYVYLFANNLDMKDLGGRNDEVTTTYRPGKATIEVPGLSRGTEIDVLDENRTVRANPGSFTDDFRPLEVHVYRFKRTAAKARPRQAAPFPKPPGRRKPKPRARPVPKRSPAEEKPPADVAVAKLYREAETAFVDGDAEGAKALFEKIARDHPDSEYAARAKEYLEIIE